MRIRKAGGCMFTWVKGNAYTLVVTLYPNNITLNNAAASYFQDVRWAMIGIDEQHEQIAIKPVTKREVDLKLVPLEHLHKVSIGKGYARISNKQIVDEIATMLHAPLNGDKFDAEFDEKQGVLIVNLQKVAQKG